MSVYDFIRQHAQTHPVCRWLFLDPLHSRIAAQQVPSRNLEARKDGRRAKRRARLALARLAVAYIQREGLGQRRGEGDGAALAPGLHLRPLLV